MRNKKGRHAGWYLAYDLLKGFFVPIKIQPSKWQRTAHPTTVRFFFSYLLSFYRYCSPPVESSHTFLCHSVSAHAFLVLGFMHSGPEPF